MVLCPAWYSVLIPCPIRLKEFFPFLWSPVLLFSVLFPYVEQRVWSGFAFLRSFGYPKRSSFSGLLFSSPKKGVFRPILDLSFCMLSSPLQNLECFSWQFSASFSQVRWTAFFLGRPSYAFNCPSSSVPFGFLKFPFGSLQICVCQVDCVVAFQEEIVGISFSTCGIDTSWCWLIGFIPA